MSSSSSADMTCPQRSVERGRSQSSSLSGRTGFHDEAKVRGPGVVTGRYGTLGRVFYIQEDFWPLNTALYVRDFKGNDPRFVAALLSSLELGRSERGSRGSRNQPQSSAHSSGHDPRAIHTGADRGDPRCDRRPDREQSAPDRAARADGAGDLPGVVRALPLPRPRGRRARGLASRPDPFRVGAHSDQRCRRNPRWRDAIEEELSYWDDETITWFTPSDLTRARAMFISSSEARITPAGLARSAARLFPARSVLMTSRATLGVISISTVEGCTNQGFIVCVPNERLSACHLYYWLLENVPEFVRLATGATFKEITRGGFPPDPDCGSSLMIEQGFAESVAPMADSIERLLRTDRPSVSCATCSFRDLSPAHWMFLPRS